MIDLLIYFLQFIKSAVAGTGSAYDGELSVLLIISFLTLILLVIISFKYYKQWQAENKRRRLFGNPIDENELEHELFE